MRSWLVGVWAVLLLLPMVPVVVFYAVFAEESYFELTDAARGIVTAGPIGAYLVLVWVGWRIYTRVSSVVAPLGPLARGLADSGWRFVAHSYHGTLRQGTFRVLDDDRGDLRFAGTFEDDQGRSVGSWESTMTHCEDGRVEVVYCLEDLRGGEPDTSHGMLVLHAEGDRPRRMTGNWVVLGRSEAHGDIECERDGGR